MINAFDQLKLSVNSLGLPVQTSWVDTIIVGVLSNSHVNLLRHLWWSKIVCDAKSSMPCFVLNDNPSDDLRQAIAALHDTYLVEQKKNRQVNVAALSFAISSYILMLLRVVRLSELTYRQSLIGDIVYDIYLRERGKVTISMWDPSLIIKIMQTVELVSYGLTLIKRYKAGAIFVNQRVALPGAALAVAGEISGIDIYSFGGDCLATVLRSKRRRKYEYSVTVEQLKSYLALGANFIDRDHNRIAEYLINKSVIRDQVLSSEKSENTFVDAKEKGKVVFVFAHVFNDFPLSNSEGLAYADYYTWLYNTLLVAAQLKSVHWIIKEHPSAGFYPRNNLVFKKLTKRFKKHTNITFYDANSPISKSNIIKTADCVVTAMGSAGFEYGRHGITVITAAKGPYSSASFAYRGDSKEEYESLLRNIPNLLKPDREKVIEARAVYNIIYWYNRVPSSLFPSIPHQKAALSLYKEGGAYLSAVLESLNDNRAVIRSEYIEYVQAISDASFQRLQRPVLAM